MAFGGPPALAVSEPVPNILLVGGSGVCSGVPRHLEHLAASLQGIGHITVVSDKNEGGFDNLGAVGAAHITVPGLATSLAPVLLWAGLVGLYRVLRACPADLIWFHARLPVLLGRMLLALRLWRPVVPVVCTYHGLPFDPGHRPVARHISRVLEKLLLTLCPPLHLVFLTETMMNDMVKTIGQHRLARHHLHVLENRSDLGALPEPVPSNHRHLVMTGRVSWQKDLDLAAKLLVQLPPDFTLTFCGPGTDSPAFCDRIAALVPSDVFIRIRFVGPVQDVRPHLATADAYLLTSRYEGTPIGALEAFEAGLPVILRDFEGAKTLTGLHPHALCLRLQDLDGDATRIVTLLDEVSARGPSVRHEIQSVWAQRWSGAQFTPAVRALVDRVLKADDPAAK